VSFDGTLKDVFMLAFFTSVGFQSDLKVIKQGGKLLVIMLTLLVGIIALQNLMPMGITKLMGAGTLLSWLLAKTGITFPTYFGALILAAIVRNTIGFVSYKEGDKWEKAEKLLDMERIISVGNICLSLFLGMAMISLRLWELQSLALPLIIILASQVLMMALFAYIVAFPLLGRNYDAAVLCAGMCGFGLGATPNAMANMSAVCYKYRYTVKPFLIVPIIGAMFADFINT